MNQHPNILIINDGNRRWAKANGLSERDGYKAMVKKVALVCDELKSRGFEKVYVTLCSVSNLSRPKETVETFYEEYLATPALCKNKIKIELHGNLDLIPEKFKKRYEDLIVSTSANSDFTLHYMVNWSLDDEIVRIFDRLHARDSKDSKNSKIDVEKIREEADIKEPIDLIIRMGSRRRLSSCIPIGSPFAEIYFLDILFPEITAQHIDDALDFYSQQRRTFGK